MFCGVAGGAFIVVTVCFPPMHEHVVWLCRDNAQPTTGTAHKLTYCTGFDGLCKKKSTKNKFES